MGRAHQGRIREREAVRMTARLLRFALPRWRWILLTLLAVTIATSSEGGYLLLIKPFIKTVSLSNAQAARTSGVSEQQAEKDVAEAIAEARKVTKYLLLLAPIMAFGILCHEYLRARVVMSVVVDIRNKLCDALLPQSLRYFETRRSGDFISRVTNDVTATQSALDFVFGDVLMQFGRLLVATCVGMYISWRLAVIGLGLMVVVSVPVFTLGRRVRAAGKRSLEKLSDLTDSMQQMFSGIRIVKAFQMEGAEAEEFQRHNRKFFSHMMRLARTKASSKSFVIFMTGTFLALLVYGGSVIVERGLWGISWGEIMTYIGCNVLGYSAVKTLAKNYNDLQQALGGVERIFEVLDHQPDIRDAPGAVSIAGMREGLAFRNVTFAYDTEPVLSDINLEVRRGETIAVVGKSGAGKSTLVNLIPRFYDPTQGRIELDGVDLRKMTHESLLSQIAVVAQQTFLFNRTIGENIRYGRRGKTSEEEVQAAATAANIHDFIAGLPEGYGTMVGEFGVRLSGGQRQRIAIARAILKNAPILILDEAMVGLDSESEAAVRDAIIRLMKGRTTFMIAHDLTEVQHADRIVVLRDGRIIEMGTHEELIARGGEYERFLSMQLSAPSSNPRPGQVY